WLVGRQQVQRPIGVPAVDVVAAGGGALEFRIAALVLDDRGRDVLGEVLVKRAGEAGEDLLRRAERVRVPGGGAGRVEAGQEPGALAVAEGAEGGGRRGVAVHGGLHATADHVLAVLVVRR